ncbi:MAG: hypothetical protein INH41_22775 [Myxococcaceae bacterium]|jgi:hypothetical protein|nr:hypothetical protein [Myxococcaceae bacterium]MCA3015223.1 hypothetical protein [Myxococcaceae bacterium]
MTRVLGAVLVLSALAGCGTPCSRIAAAEQAADDKGSGCNSSRNAWTPSQVTTCEGNLDDCTQNDLKQLDLYAQCLNALPRCGEGQRTSWELQRFACASDNLLLKVSARCASR